MPTKKTEIFEVFNKGTEKTEICRSPTKVEGFKNSDEIFKLYPKKQRKRPKINGKGILYDSKPIKSKPEF